MNDPMEMKWGYEKIFDMLPSIEKELGVVDPVYQLSRLWDKDVSHSKEELSNFFIECHDISFLHPFVISLSQTRDSLPIWGMYGGNGTGVALGFDLRLYYIELEQEGGCRRFDITHINFDDIHAIDMEYDTLEKFKTCYGIVRSDYHKYWESVCGITDGKEIAQRQLKALSSMIMYAAPFIKHNAYRYEKESRIIKFHESITDIKFRTNAKGTIIPYLEVPIPTSALKEIIIGPCCNFNLIKKSLEIILLQKGIKTDDIEITPSSQPYRNNY